MKLLSYYYEMYFYIFENVLVIMISFQRNPLQIFPSITSNNFMIQICSF
jgi:hypothetical protein